MVLRLLVFLLLSAGPLTAANRIFSPRIKTLCAVVGDNWLSPAVMELGSGDVLNVSFDDLTHTYHRYIYKVEHCEADWSSSDGLFESDYIVGFNGNPIEDYQTSINTTVLYTHYSLQLPNDRCKLRMSGNYRLNIYNEDDGGECVAQVEFRVVENLANVGLEVTTNTDIDVNQSHQQLTVSLDYGEISVTNPDEEIFIVVRQNDRDDNERRGLRPNIRNTKGLRWEHNRELIFDGGNEYHKFETLDLSHPTMGIDRIEWDGHHYHAYPFAAEPRRNYLTDEDADGAFFIRNSEYTEVDYTCDYAFVHYKLLAGEAFDGTLYVDGQWATDADRSAYSMTYDASDGSYNAVVLQKQGYYSYQFLLQRHDGTMTIPPSEGSFYETENSYQAYIYYKKTGERTWRLVGYRRAVTG